MDDEYRKIRDRYEDVVFSVIDAEMFQDVLSLLQYIESLHGQLAHYRAGAEISAEPCGGFTLH
jgi:hypothetical protein